MFIIPKYRIVLLIFFVIVPQAFAQELFPNNNEQPSAQTPPKINPAEIYTSIRQNQINSPASIFINDATTLNLPEKLSFIPTDNAEILLNMNGSEGGPNLIGLIVGTDDFEMNWYIAIRDNKIGYMIDSDIDKLNAEGLLDKIKNEIKSYSAVYAVQQGLTTPEIENVSWIVPPTYDKDKHTLTWLLQTHFKGGDPAETTQQGINYKTNLFYKKGFIQFSFSSSLSNLIRGKEIVASIVEAINIQAPYRYIDFDQEKDEIAPISVRQLIAGKVEGEEPPPINNKEQQPGLTNTTDNPIKANSTINSNYQNSSWSLWFFLLLLLIAVGFIGYDSKKSKIKIKD